MNKRNIIYIIISIICVISIIVAVYYQIFKKGKNTTNEINNANNITKKEDDKQDIEQIKAEFDALFNNTFDDQGYDISKIQKIEGLEENDVIYTAYSIKQEKQNQYNVNLNLPLFNVKGEVGTQFNNITQTVFVDKAKEILTKTEKYTIYEVNYVAYVNENILSLVIRSTLKEGNNPQRVIVQAYNYDIDTGKKVSLNDILNQKQIDIKTVNKKIEEVVVEANKQAEALSSALSGTGQIIYKRDLNNAMYVTDNVNQFFIGADGQIFILYPYGNSNFTSEMDIIKV